MTHCSVLAFCYVLEPIWELGLGAIIIIAIENTNNSIVENCFFMFIFCCISNQHFFSVSYAIKFFKYKKKMKTTFQHSPEILVMSYTLSDVRWKWKVVYIVYLRSHSLVSFLPHAPPLGLGLFTRQ